MSLIKDGKGWFIWLTDDIVERFYNGDVNALAQYIIENNYSHVIFKISDGVVDYFSNPWTQNTKMPELYKILKNNNIQVFGFQYVYGKWNPQKEAEVLNDIVRNIFPDIDGIVLDIETEFDNLNMRGKAQIYVNTLIDKKLTKDYPIILSSFRYISYHPNVPWDIFVPICDVIMPQCYWVLANGTAAYQTQRTINENINLINKYNPDAELVLTGACFREGMYDWQTILSDVKDFVMVCKKNNINAINFWELRSAAIYLPNQLKYINNLNYDSSVHPEEPKDEIVVTVGKSNIRKAPLVAPSTQLGHTYRGKKFNFIDKVKDNKGKTWYKIVSYIHESCVREI